MRGGFDRLVKEIDALTYNARSSINAMIRSTIAAGTSNGYKVTRVGIEILLTREDIYKLDKFYKQWEESKYDTSIFDDIVADVGAGESLEKHSKILYLNNDTVGAVNTQSYWLGLIKDANNPKLISNSAPIPINIRTPIFDENMATTKYNQDETYLFPFAYYSVDLLGYSGDDVNHHMDGASWTISADNYISMETDAFSTGGVNSSDTRKTKARRNHDIDSNGNALEVTYSTANGYATQARAKYSHASGFGSIVPRGAVSGVAIGDRLLATDSYAASVGGSLNKSVGVGSGVFAGKGNVAAGAYSAIIAGLNNSVGSTTHTFKFPISDANSITCLTVNNDCVSEETGAYAGKNVISITGNIAGLYEIGATVSIHTLTVFSDTSARLSYWETNGDGFKTQYFTITSVEYIDPTTFPSNVNRGNTLITLSGDIAGSKVDGGYITKVVDAKGNVLGYASVAMNNSNIALGANQTVVGKYNSPNSTARFVVGNGNGSGDYVRSNVLEVYDDGITVYGTQFDGTYNTSTAMLSDATSVFHRFNYIGIYSKIQEARFELNKDYSALTIGSYIGLFQSETSTDYDLMLSAYKSPLIIRSGASRTYKHIPYDSDILLTSASSLLLEASDYITLDADNTITVTTENNLIMNWSKSLKLYGNTFGALPTSDDQYSHYVSFNYINLFTEKGAESTFGGVIKSGFFDILNTGTGNQMTRGYGDISRMSSCQFLNIGDYTSYSSYAWKLMFPTLIDTVDPIPNIGVMFNETDLNGNETTVSKARTPRYLAYKDEIGGTSFKTTDSSTIISHLIWNNTKNTSIPSIKARVNEVDYVKVRGGIFLRIVFCAGSEVNSKLMEIVFKNDTDFIKNSGLLTYNELFPVSSRNTNIIYSDPTTSTETTAYATLHKGAIFGDPNRVYITIQSPTTLNAISAFSNNNTNGIIVFNIFCPLDA